MTAPGHVDKFSIPKNTLPSRIRDMSEQLPNFGQAEVLRRTETLLPTVIQLSALSNAGALNKRLKAEVRKLRKCTPNGRPDSWASIVYMTLNTAD
jgi:hypothetical protein